ncbi:MAG: hypothetical protein ACPHYG_04280, partial [Flavobacteriales bacterium]
MNALAQHIVSWLQEYARTANMNGWVVGVSGGIDSAVTSTLCAETGLPTCVVEMPIHQHPSQVSRAQAHMQALEQPDVAGCCWWVARQGGRIRAIPTMPLDGNGA